MTCSGGLKELSNGATHASEMFAYKQDRINHTWLQYFYSQDSSDAMNLHDNIETQGGDQELKHKQAHLIGFHTKGHSPSAKVWNRIAAEGVELNYSPNAPGIKELKDLLIDGLQVREFCQREVKFVFIQLLEPDLADSNQNGERDFQLLSNISSFLESDQLAHTPTWRAKGSWLLILQITAGEVSNAKWWWTSLLENEDTMKCLKGD